MKRHPRTKIQVLAVGVTAVALGLTASPAHAADLNLGNLAQVKVLDGNKVADVQVPGLNTGVSVDTGNGVNAKVSVGGSGGANVGVNLGGGSGGNVNVKVGGDDTTPASDPSGPSSPNSGPSTPSKPSKPAKGSKTTVKKVVKRLGADASGKGHGASTGSGNGSTTYTYLTSGSSGSSGKGSAAKSGGKGSTTTAGTATGTDGTATRTAGDGTTSSALSSDGDRLTDGTGHSTLFWAWWLLFAALVGAGLTFLGTRLRRRHQENLLRKRMAALGEELAASDAAVAVHAEDEEKELVSAVPGLAPPRRV